MKIICAIIALLFFSNCSRETYSYEGKEYKVYTELRNDNHDIQALDLSGRPEQISRRLYELENLVYLNLSEMGLDSVPPEICELKSLKVLLLNKNESVKIPSCLFGMTNLEVISILGCRYKHIPARFGDMSNLKMFVIMANDFTEDELRYFKERMPNTKIVSYLD